jgi:hypothetical protein
VKMGGSHPPDDETGEDNRSHVRKHMHKASTHVFHHVGVSWQLLTSSLGRVCLFLFVAMPITFMALLFMGGYLMSYLQGWEFVRGYNFMAGATTTGAIVMPADPPERQFSKFYASMAGSSGVAIFGFMVAVLMNSIVNPLIEVFGLRNHQGHVFARLGFLAFVIMVTNMMFAVVFGWIFTFMEPQVGFEPAFKMMASVELGGGVVFNGQAAPITPWGCTFYIIIGTWALGVSVLMIAIAGGPGMEIIEYETGLALDEGATAASAAKAVAFLTLVVLPVVLCLAMLMVATLMSLTTSWDFMDAFWKALPATTGGACALHVTGLPQLNLVGTLTLICAASTGFFIVCLFIGIGAKMFRPVIMSFPFLREKEGVSHAIIALLVNSFIKIPLTVYTFAVPMGVILALTQGWEFQQGFWWCVAVQLGGGMALTSVQIHSWFGMVIATFAVAWSIGISIVSVGLGGSPAVEPLIEALGMTIDAEELKETMRIRPLKPSSESPNV